AGIQTREAQTAVFTRTLEAIDRLDTQLSRVILADRPLIYYRFDQMDSERVTNLANDRYHGPLLGPREMVQTPLPAWRLNSDAASEPSYMKVEQQLRDIVGNTWSVELWLCIREPKSGLAFNLRKKFSEAGSYGSVWYETDLAPPTQ